MNRDVVLVAEDPIMWKTLIRLTGNEPPVCTEQRNDNDVAPYYTDEQQYPVIGYSKDELIALKRLNPMSGKWYVRLQGIDGAVSYADIGDQDQVRAVLDSEVNRMASLFRDFFICIGAAGCVDIENKEITATTEEKKAGLNGSGKMTNAEGNDGEGGLNAKIERAVKADESSHQQVHLEFPSATPDLEAAAKLLKKYAFLDREFRGVYNAVKRGVKDNERDLKKTCKVEHSEEITRISKSLIGISVKYKQQMSASLRMQYDCKTHRASDSRQTISYCVRL